MQFQVTIVEKSQIPVLYSFRSSMNNTRGSNEGGFGTAHNLRLS